MWRLEIHQEGTESVIHEDVFLGWENYASKVDPQPTDTLVARDVALGERVRALKFGPNGMHPDFTGFGMRLIGRGGLIRGFDADGSTQLLFDEDYPNEVWEITVVVPEDLSDQTSQFNNH